MRASNKYLPVLSIFFRTYAPQSIGAGYPNESDGTLTYGNALRCSCLIYNPNRRNDIWRFGTYMFLHSGWHHLFWNIGIQLMVGEFTSLKGFSASNCDVGSWIFYIFFCFFIFLYFLLPYFLYIIFFIFHFLIHIFFISYFSYFHILHFYISFFNI